MISALLNDCQIPSRSTSYRSSGTTAILDDSQIPSSSSGKTLDESDVDLFLCRSSSIASGYDYTDHVRYLFLVACKKWECEICGPRKRHDLAKRIVKEKPNRFLTLTIRNPNQRLTIDEINSENYLPTGQPKSPRDAFDESRRKVSELFRYFKKQGRPQEYVRILEQTKSGWPHYHFLMKGPKPWPKHEITAKWKSLTGSYIVDIQFIRDDGKSVSYVTKYLQKSNGVEFTKRRVSYSRKFFRKSTREKKHSDLVDWYFVKDGYAHEFILKLLDDSFLTATDSMTCYRIDERSPGDDVIPRLRNYLEAASQKMVDELNSWSPSDDW